jgi:crotonobetainyl-CoA:carnitine CoA-transferase CaiB-like acyl-CoA transferase
VQTFPTADGWIIVMFMNEKFWMALIQALHQESLARDPRFARLSGVLPVGPVYDVADALSSSFAQAVGMIQTVAHPEKPDLKLLGSTIKMNGMCPALTACPPLGADNHASLGPAAQSRAAVPR